MRRAGFALAAFAVLTAAALAQAPAGEAGPAPEGAAPTAPTPETPDIAALNPLSTLDKGSLTGFRDIPLFTPSRKRPTPPAVAAEAPEPEPEAEPDKPEPEAPEPELKLSGVVEGPEGAMAVVQKDGATERLRLGDQVDGWLVTGIEGYVLKLTLNEREKEYRMFERQEGASAKSEAGEDGAAGKNDQEPGEAGQDPSGDDMSGQDSAEPDQAEPDQASPDPAEQNPADQPEGEQPDGQSSGDADKAQ